MKHARHVQFAVGGAIDDYHGAGGQTRLDRGLVEAEVWGHVFASIRRPLVSYPAIHEAVRLAGTVSADRLHLVRINAHPREYDALAACFKQLSRREAGRQPELRVLEHFLSAIALQDLDALIELGLKGIPELSEVIVRTDPRPSSAHSF